MTWLLPSKPTMGRNPILLVLPIHDLGYKLYQAIWIAATGILVLRQLKVFHLFQDNWSLHFEPLFKALFLYLRNKPKKSGTMDSGNNKL